MYLHKNTDIGIATETQKHTKAQKQTHTNTYIQIPMYRYTGIHIDICMYTCIHTYVRIHKLKSEREKSNPKHYIKLKFLSFYEAKNTRVNSSLNSDLSHVPEPSTPIVALLG